MVLGCSGLFGHDFEKDFVMLACVKTVFEFVLVGLGIATYIGFMVLLCSLNAGL